MPKRKNTPVKLQNKNENWSFSSLNDISFGESVNDEATPVKTPRLKRVKQIQANIQRCSVENQKFFIDRLLIGKSKNVIPEEWKKCKVKITEGVLMLNFDTEDYVIVQIDQTEDQSFVDIFSAHSSNSPKFLFFNFDINIENEDVFASIYLQLPIVKYNKKVGHVLKTLFNKKFGTAIHTEFDDKKIKNSDNLDDFYKDIHEYRTNCDNKFLQSDVSVQHSSLLPTLRPYQVEAVKWMINREKICEVQENLHPLYEVVTLDSGQVVYFNLYTGYVETLKPMVPSMNSGGILADEMGLGKTVEVLACILNNPRPDSDVDKNLETVENEDASESYVDLKIDLCEINGLKKQIDGLINQNEGSINQNVGLKNQDDHWLNQNEDLVHQNEDSTDHNEDSIDPNTQPNDSMESIQNIVGPNSSEAHKEIHETIPVVDTQSKYKKPKLKINKKPPKKETPVLTGIEKPKKKKSAAKIAAELWYENKLAEMKIRQKPKPRNEDFEVKCICGDLSEVGVIHCKDCNKMQHPKCLGYNGRPKDFICPQCWLNKPLIKSKATLIVSPISICRQWSQEIQRHIRQGGLKVLIYKGIHEAGVMYPTDLANYDLIITTYSVLQSEIKFSSEEQCRISFRYAKRYNNPSTPLLNINFWRLCLDEAQMVDCPTSQVSCMAHQLNAVHRWAVTGTPIQKNISDLYGLVEYLKLSPFNDLYTWNNLLFYPYLDGKKEPLLNFLSKVLWRSTKSEVLTQINIPPQTIKEHWFEFSAVEKYFYKKEHFCAANDFLEKLKDFESLDVRLKSLDKKFLSKILAPLLALRQACVHPNSVRGRYLAKSKVDSMEELLEALIKKNVKECEESLRAMLASLNGMAGIMLLKDDSIEAVATYREALQVMSKYDEHQFIKIDKLQKVHTLYNLVDVLSDKSYPAPPPTLRDEKLAEECELVQKQYMEKFISETRAAFVDAQVATEAVTKLKRKFRNREGEWLCELNDWFITQSYESEFLKRVSNSLDANCKIKYEDIASARSVMYLLTTWIDKINKKSEKLEKLFDQFQNQYCTVENGYQMDENIVNDAMECHLRPSKSRKKEKKSLCKICQLDQNLKKYELDLFLMKTRKNDVDEDINVGSWHPSFEERLIKLIYTFAKQKDADKDLLKEGETHLKLCEFLRKEFKELRRLYTFYDKQISAQDELNICKIRFRLKNPEEPVKKIEKKQIKNLDYEIKNQFEFINVLNPYDLDLNYSTLIHEKKLAEIKLVKLIGTHNYLEKLKNQQYSGQEPDPCPICASKLEDSWAIMQCGHCYCLDCLEKLVNRNKLAQNISCSVCRAKQLSDDISYIKLKGTNDKTDDFEIQGSYSTKIQAIIKHVLLLQKEEEGVKILIFSSWQSVLKVLNNAFTKNNISFEYLTSNNLQEKLDNFKSESKKITACLIPISLGAKGLNLIEATHVFLVEPLLNPGEELQAIGRVHRIGQTKPTFVHRFLIKNTIEENIHNAIAANVKQWDNNRLTLAQLKELFVEKDLNNSQEADNQEELLMEND